MRKMNQTRRWVLQTGILGAGGCVFPRVLAGAGSPRSLCFGICADVHRDIMYDAEKRLSVFLARMRRVRPKFVIQLGDFCFPKPENDNFLRIWNGFQGRRYHVLGNHEMDSCSKQEIMDYWGMKRNSYSFDAGEFHFIVLDPNYLLLDGVSVSYDHGNYFRHPEARGHVPAEELEWLREDLAGTDRTSFLFSHQSLEHPKGVRNRKAVRAILERANREAGFAKVAACFSGHHHIDYSVEINGIHYVQINSMSYHWMGEKCEHSGRFGAEVEEAFPAMRFTAPYRDPLYAVVTLDPEGRITISGKRSVFVPPAPAELGCPTLSSGHRISATISDRTLTFPARDVRRSGSTANRHPDRARPSE